MRFILSTGSLYNYRIDRVFALAAEAGFDGIELLIDHRWDTRQSDYLRQLMGKPSAADPGPPQPVQPLLQRLGRDRVRRNRPHRRTGR